MQFDNYAAVEINAGKTGNQGRVSSTSERIEQIGAAIRRERQNLNMSQKALAEAMGTDQAVIARLEAGKHNAGIATYIRAADALGISFADLIEF